MNCIEAKPFLYDYALEGTRTADLDAHLAACDSCRAELADLQLTHKLMRQGLPEEEPPRRISFVADAAPRHALRFWQWSFVGATAVAFLFAVMLIRRPAITSSGPLLTRAEVDAMVAQKVAEAVSASEERQKAETAAVIQNAAERMGEQLHYLQSTQSQVYRQTEQNRSAIHDVALLVGGREGVRQ